MAAIVLVTRRLPQAVEDRLRRDYAPRLNPDDRPYGADELLRHSADAAAILTCATDAWPASVIDRLWQPAGHQYDRSHALGSDRP